MITGIGQIVMLCKPFKNDCWPVSYNLAEMKVTWKGVGYI